MGTATDSMIAFSPDICRCFIITVSDIATGAVCQSCGKPMRLDYSDAASTAPKLKPRKQKPYYKQIENRSKWWNR